MKFKIEKENFFIQLTDEEKLDVNILKRVSDKIFRNFKNDKNLIISKNYVIFQKFLWFLRIFITIEMLRFYVKYFKD